MGHPDLRQWTISIDQVNSPLAHPSRSGGPGMRGFAQVEGGNYAQNGQTEERKVGQAPGDGAQILWPVSCFNREVPHLGRSEDRYVAREAAEGALRNRDRQPELIEGLLSDAFWHPGLRLLSGAGTRDANERT